MEHFEVRCPSLHLGDQYTDGARDAKIDVSGDFLRATIGTGPHYIPGTEYSIHIPFDGDAEIFRLQTQPVFGSAVQGRIDGQELVLSVAMPADSLTAERVKQQLDGQLNAVVHRLSQAREQILTYNGNVTARAPAVVQRRRDKVLRDRELDAFIAVPVGRRPNIAPILAVDVPRKSRHRTAPALTQPFTPEPALAANDFRGIVGAIASFGQAAERFPQTFGPMSEPVLREILLVILNNQFGPAVGEMFSRKGKSDIAIVHGRGPVFIAECKIWKGPENFKNAIDQLLDRYLVWRDTKAALVLFVKHKNVTAVIDKSKTVLAHHARFKNRPQPTAGQSVFVLHHQDDVAREIELALIVVPVPPGEATDDPADGENSGDT